MARILLIVFCLSEVLLSTVISEPSYPIWANETRLGKYQDAWKILNQSDVYYLVNSTFNSAEYLWGLNFSCVSVRMNSSNPDDRISQFQFLNMSKPTELQTLELRTSPYKTYNYSMYNAIQYQLKNCSFINDTVIFTDGETCNLLSVPYQNDGNGCELWVKESYLKNKTTPSCCYFLFDLLCADTGSYDIYNDTCLTVGKSSNDVQSSDVEIE